MSWDSHGSGLMHEPGSPRVVQIDACVRWDFEPQPLMQV